MEDWIEQEAEGNRNNPGQRESAERKTQCDQGGEEDEVVQADKGRQTERRTQREADRHLVYRIVTRFRRHRELSPEEDFDIMLTVWVMHSRSA